jgi:hypothetical protein
MRLVCVSDLAARGAKPTAPFGAGPESALSFVIARDRIALQRFGEVGYYYSRCDNRPGSEEIRKWDRFTTVLPGVQGRHKSKKEKLRLVAVAALAAKAQEGCFDASLPFHRMIPICKNN